jgi:hypothetical protein
MTFRWVHIHDKDELEAFYRSVLPAIREAARALGYAIGVHGSMRRDLDLIAVPWTEDAADRDTLARAIHRAACGLENGGADHWEQKPCGRVATALPICWTERSEALPPEPSLGHIDLSVVNPGPSEGRSDG